MRRVLLQVVAVLAFTLGPAIAQVAVTPDLSNERNEEQAAALVSALTLFYPKTLVLLAKEFPTDHADLIADIEEIGATTGGHPDELLLGAFGKLRELRIKYQSKIAFAPSLTHSLMLGLIADFHDDVLAKEGASVCGRFARDGAAVLFELGLSGKYGGALDRQSLVYFEAVVQAIETPEYREGVRTEDWGVLLAAMLAAGAPDSYVTSIASGRPNDPELCPALAAMFRTSGLLDVPEGARTRADLARNLTGY